MSYRIIVGLPSRNEADSIGKVTADIDAALATLPFSHTSLLVNADNDSTDGTPDVFTATSTRSSKQVIRTSSHGGKGGNFKAVFDLAASEGADAVLVVDTDLTEVPASWVHTLLNGVRDGLDFCYPLRPPTWNGGDLTYQLAYPLLAGIFGADLREPLCGDIAISGRAAADLNAETWQPEEILFGVDFMTATHAVQRRWRAVHLQTRRQNKLRSFTTTVDEDYRMGAKFREVSASVGYRCAQRLNSEPPPSLVPNPEVAPIDDVFVVPRHDPDLAGLSASGSRRLRADADDHAFTAFTPALAARLCAHADGNPAGGMGWDLWRDCLFEWIAQIARGGPRLDPELLETLFLNRVVGHHTEIAGTSGWYQTVVEQAHDTFHHRAALWAAP